MSYNTHVIHKQYTKRLAHLRLCDGRGADARVDGVPGAGREHAGEKREEVSGAEPAAVALHAAHVAGDQGLPQPTVVQSEAGLQLLDAREARDITF